MSNKGPKLELQRVYCRIRRFGMDATVRDKSTYSSGITVVTTTTRISIEFLP